MSEVSRTTSDFLGGATPALVTDFGGLVRGAALGSVAPRSAEELQSIVLQARERGVGLTPRGGGNSQSGQAVADESVQVSFGSLRGAEWIDDEHVRCQAGASFEDVLRITLPRGCAPVVMPLNLDLTVGGVLAAGGLGSSSHRFGFLAACVTELTAVMGDGTRVTASPERQRDVFDCVLGGLGRYGFIVDAVLRLERVPSKLTTTTMLYEEVQHLLSDQLALSIDEKVLHLEGVLAACILGTTKKSDNTRLPLRRWSHALHVTTASMADAESVCSRLAPSAVISRQSDTIDEFAHRYTPRFRMMRESGAWEQTHPWFEALVSAEVAEELLTMAQALPPFFGDMIRVASVAYTDAPLAIAVPERRPSNVTHCISLAVLPSGIPEALSGAARAVLKPLNERLLDLGGKRYLSGWLCDPDSRVWRRQYGSNYERLLQLQRQFNREGTLRSRLPYLL